MTHYSEFVQQPVIPKINLHCSEGSLFQKYTLSLQLLVSNPNPISLKISFSNELDQFPSVLFVLYCCFFFRSAYILRTRVMRCAPTEVKLGYLSARVKLLEMHFGVMSEIVN